MEVVIPHKTDHDSAIHELLAVKQWKQALNLCEKKLKKSEDKGVLCVTKVRVLFQWPDPIRHEQGVKELGLLLDRKPPIADPDALILLDQLIKQYGPFKDFIPKRLQIWQRAAISNPWNSKLHTVWFRSNFDQQDYDGAQQACMAWMKNFPTDRKPFFLYILTTHLISENVNDLQRKGLAQALAYKYISKAAADTPSPIGAIPDPGKQISSPQDLYLLLRIYRAQNRYEEAIAICKDSRFCLDVHTGTSKWEVCEQYIEFLAMQGRWEELHAICGQMLINSLQAESTGTSIIHEFNLGILGNNWNVWRMMLRANSKQVPVGEVNDTHKFILSFHDHTTGSRRRNCSLALLYYYANELYEERLDQHSVSKAVTDYFHDFSSKLTCFNDLSFSFCYLDTQAQRQVWESIAKLALEAMPQPKESEAIMIMWITIEINILKLDYHLVVSRDENILRIDLLISFISNCLRLYRISCQFGRHLPASDRRPGDDAAILAVMGLVRLFKLGRKPALIQSIFVLETLLLHSVHNYDALLILVRLYLFLGAGSLAIERYSRLSIKNLQHATISWVLFSRISTVHPHPAIYPQNGKGYLTVDLKHDAFQVLKWYQTAAELTHKSVRQMQEEDQWITSLDSLATMQSVVSGCARFSIFVEAKRMARLRSSKAEETPTLYMKVPKQTQDTRDRTAFPNYEGGSLSFEEHLPSAGTSKDPNDWWLGKQLLLARLWDIFNNSRSDLDRSEVDALIENSEEDVQTLTEAEDITFNLTTILAKLHTVFTLEDKYDQEPFKKEALPLFIELENSLAEINEILESNVKTGKYASMPLKPEFHVPLWKTFHNLYSYLDSCKLVDTAMGFVIAENKKKGMTDHPWLLGTSEALQRKSMGLVELCARFASDLQGNLRQQKFARQIHDAIFPDADHMDDEDDLAKELQRLKLESNTEWKCEEIRDSWIEGLNGVLGTSVA